jgi:hypothetical protein
MTIGIDLGDVLGALIADVPGVEFTACADGLIATSSGLPSGTARVR